MSTQDKDNEERTFGAQPVPIYGYPRPLLFSQQSPTATRLMNAQDKEDEERPLGIDPREELSKLDDEDFIRVVVREVQERTESMSRSAERRYGDSIRIHLEKLLDT